MGKVRTGLAVSLDGFISGPNDGADAPVGHGGERLLAWYGTGDTEPTVWKAPSRKIDLVPVLLGGGVSLFDHLGTGPIDLERTRVIEGAGVTHLTFRVLK